MTALTPERLDEIDSIDFDWRRELTHDDLIGFIDAARANAKLVEALREVRALLGLQARHHAKHGSQYPMTWVAKAVSTIDAALAAAGVKP